MREAGGDQAGVEPLEEFENVQAAGARRRRDFWVADVMYGMVGHFGLSVNVGQGRRHAAATGSLWVSQLVSRESHLLYPILA